MRLAANTFVLLNSWSSGAVTPAPGCKRILRRQFETESACASLTAQRVFVLIFATSAKVCLRREHDHFCGPWPPCHR